MSNLGYREEQLANWGARSTGQRDGFGRAAAPELSPDGDEQVGLRGQLAIALGVCGGGIAG